MNRGTLPGKPLAAAIRRCAGGKAVIFTCKKVGITERALCRYARGEGDVTVQQADRILTRLHLNWWDVWNEDTVREYMIVAQTWQMTVKNYGRRDQGPTLTRVRRCSREYMDIGTDYASLLRIEALMNGRPQPKFAEIKHERPLYRRINAKRAAMRREEKKKRPGRPATEARSSS